MLEEQVRELLEQGKQFPPPNRCSYADITSVKAVERKLDQTIRDLTKVAPTTAPQTLVVRGCEELGKEDDDVIIAKVLKVTLPKIAVARFSAHRMGRPRDDGSSRPIRVQLECHDTSTEDVLRNRLNLRDVCELNGVFVQRLMSRTEMEAAYQSRVARRAKITTKTRTNPTQANAKHVPNDVNPDPASIPDKPQKANANLSKKPAYPGNDIRSNTPESSANTSHGSATPSTSGMPTPLADAAQPQHDQPIKPLYPANEKRTSTRSRTGTAPGRSSR
jgi:hypothetical protein